MAEKHQQAGYAVGWFTLALLNAGLAKALKLSGLLWFLLSLLLGPCATCYISVRGEGPSESAPTRTSTAP